MSGLRVPCVIMRGGTSKGLFFHESDLPADPCLRDAMLLAAFGSPDPRQVDGLGGADPLTSKLAIVRPSTAADVDVDYTFGQVSIDHPSINYALNCGNIVAGVAVFAIEEGLVQVEEPVTTVRIFNTNTKTHIVAKVLVRDGRCVTTGDCAIDGVPGTGAAIELSFLGTAGRTTGKLLPTGLAVERLELSGHSIDVSIVDTGNIYVFVAAKDLGLRGDETAAELEGDPALIRVLLSMLDACTSRVRNAIGSSTVQLHKVGIIASPDVSGAEQPGADVMARIVSSNGRAHRAYAVTGAICTASAAFVEGSVVNRALSRPVSSRIVIAHPQGRIEIGVDFGLVDGVRRPVTGIFTRTARRIMDGFVRIDRPLDPDFAQSHRLATSIATAE
jgi:methylitaconate Delta-isomerase